MLNIWSPVSYQSQSSDCTDVVIISLVCKLWPSLAVPSRSLTSNTFGVHGLLSFCQLT